ncbi:F0F1 ATP synthase subunit B [uncultured Ezakiella sp.]|uniref:F0F1 ATP synthase subunit B n=1 Tax=uncultured Ezakiella sp. TaxID=1637529 RepID=UPI0025CCE4F8|nr:F0F1 ATP synthase subunit B [uncultured Ezakiella sp.]
MDITINVFPDLLNFSVTIVTTLVLFLGLRHLLFKPVTEYLNNRKAYIENNIKSSEELKSEAEELRNDYSSRIDEANNEARDILANARKNSDKIVSNAKNEAETEKARIIASANKEADEMKQKAFSNLKDEIVDIAILTAKDLSDVDHNPETARKFTDKRIKDLGEVKWQK